MDLDFQGLIQSVSVDLIACDLITLPSLHGVSPAGCDFVAFMQEYHDFHAHGDWIGLFHATQLETLIRPLAQERGLLLFHSYDEGHAVKYAQLTFPASI